MSRVTIRHGLIVTCIHEAYEALRITDGDIFIEEGVIKRIGRNLKSEGAVIDAQGKCILPGFINAHCHSFASVVLKGLVEGYNLGRMGPELYRRIPQITETGLSALSHEEIESLLSLSVIEKLDGGTTTALEQCSKVEMEPWMRLGNENRLPVEIVLNSLETTPLGKRDEKKGSDWVGPVPFEHWDQLERIRKDAKFRAKRILLNLPETRKESETFQRTFGTTPVRYLADASLLGSALVINHCAFADEEEQNRLRETGTHVVYCKPLVIERGEGPSFWSHPSSKTNLAIGTDHHSGDMLSTLREVSLVENLRGHGPGTVKAYDLFYAATAGGAKALGRKDLGRIVEGYRANLLIANTMHGRLRPFAFPLISLIHHGCCSDIETVLVDGKIVKEEGTLMGFDVQAVAERAEKAVWKSWAQCRRVGIL